MPADRVFVRVQPVPCWPIVEELSGDRDDTKDTAWSALSPQLLVESCLVREEQNSRVCSGVRPAASSQTIVEPRAPAGEGTVPVTVDGEVARGG